MKGEAIARVRRQQAIADENRRLFEIRRKWETLETVQETLAHVDRIRSEVKSAPVPNWFGFGAKVSGG